MNTVTLLLDMYRGLTLSPVTAKVFELVLLQLT